MSAHVRGFEKKETSSNGAARRVWPTNQTNNACHAREAILSTQRRISCFEERNPLQLGSGPYLACALNVAFNAGDRVFRNESSSLQFDFFFFQGFHLILSRKSQSV